MKKNQKQHWQAQECDALDHELDTALAKYAVADPRMGLEERILANLQAEREHAPNRAWWRWSAAAAFAVVVFVIICLAGTGIWRAPTITQRPPAMEPQIQLPAPHVASDSTAKPLAHRPNPVAPADPKLDQFPSPQPLSDQEKILASYVDAYPERALLLARARTEALRRDQIEETRSYSRNDEATDSENRKNDTSER
jgi:hypothetical protein